MSTDFRALCAELLSELENAIRVIYGEDGTRHISSADPVIAKADVALSEPEPERLTVQQINDLPEHGENFIYSNSKWPDEITLDGHFTRTQLQQLANSVPTSRSNKTMTELSPEALAEHEPKPAGLSDEELLRCAKIATPCYNLDGWKRELEMMRAAIAADRAQRQPVPVSERLPGPEDCDAEGRCWLRRKHQLGGPTWWLARPASIGTEALRIYYAEWLPAHALPLPGEVEG